MATAAPGVVLVVDDNADTNEALRAILDLRRYESVAAFDGRDALVQLRTGLRPAVIVLDLLMPNLDGWGVLRELVADPELRHIPVVIYSALRERVADGVAAYVPKGDDPDVLLNVIAGLSSGPLSS